MDITAGIYFVELLSMKSKIFGLFFFLPNALKKFRLSIVDGECFCCKLKWRAYKILFANSALLESMMLLIEIVLVTV